ncbi:AraC family transcriptional regulator [Nocardia sp. NPDC051570]|uniref:AraC family transcriptional regulator n=1 Tax=Nocardia sp. NPDC051570 TaxID=3364324 RepID=UPI0037B97A4A
MIDWELPRSAVSVLLMTRFGAERGVTAPECLADTGIDATVLDDPETTVTPHSELQVTRNIHRLCRSDPDAAIELGTRYHASVLGPWAGAMSSSATLGVAVDVSCRDFGRAFGFGTMLLDVAGDGSVVVRIDDSELPADIAPFLADRTLAAAITVYRELLPFATGPRLIRFRHERPTRIDRFHEIFDCDLEFGADANAIVLDDTALDQPMPQRNEPAFQAMTQHCRRLLDMRSDRVGAAGATRAVLLCNPHHLLDQVAVAATLRMSSRTLYRRLQTEGTTFREIAEQVRKELAIGMLADPHLTAAEIARRLGYATPACFNRAFKRWTGSSPGQLRVHRSRNPAA